MAKFTVELTYDLPMYVHRVIDAGSAEAAVAYALENEDWHAAKEDHDSCGPTRVTGLWAGETAYEGRQLVGTADPYTVILRHPDWLDQADNGWSGTVQSHELADSPEEAFGLAQDRQCNEHGGKSMDWGVVAVFAGHLQCLHLP